MRGDKEFLRPVQQGLILISLTTLFAVLVIALYSVRWVVITTLLGLGIGVIAAPAVDLLYRRLKIPRGLGSVLVMFTVVGGFLGLGFTVVTGILNQIPILSQKLTALGYVVQQKYQNYVHQYQWLPTGLHRWDLNQFLSSAPPMLFRGLQIGLSGMAGVVFVIAVSIYLAVNPGMYIEGLLSAFPKDKRPEVRAQITRSGQVLRRWFRAELMAMALVGTVTALGLRLLGSEYWLLFGFLTALMELVPYIGPAVAFSAVVIVTAATTPGKVLATLAVYLGILQIEGNVIVPLVMKGRIRLPPIQLLFLMFVMGEWFGAIGLLIASPMLAVLRSIYLSTYVARLENKSLPAEPAQTRAEAS